jgi:hypothetical protein
MNESNFRQLVHKAIGDSDAPAYLSTHARMALRQSVARRPARLNEGMVVLAALVVAVAVLAALFTPRLFTQLRQPVGVSSPEPSPQTPSPTQDPTACRIPVVVDDNHTRSRRPNLIAGFVEVATGQFTADKNVSFAGFPDLALLGAGAPPASGGPLSIATYDPVVKRWIPSNLLSPDQLSYLYVVWKGGSSELHTYDLVQGKDRIVWSIGTNIDVPFWRTDGIYVSANLYVPFDQRFWRIDPASGEATVIDGAVFTPYTAFMKTPGAHLFWSGPDPERTLYANGGRDTGTRYTEFVIIDGKRVEIYSGVMGDQMGFDPSSVWVDGSRLWFSNFDSKVLWTWTSAGGLVRYPIQIPNATGDPTHPVTYRVAGPCVT